MKLGLRTEKFITREELRFYCRKLHLDYLTAIGYLTANDYAVRILRGIFYIKSIEEKKLKKINLDYMEAIKEALGIKGIENWYFGLETAVKLNGLTHEYFTVDYVINDTISRPIPLEILRHKIKFIKISKNLFNFGIIKKKMPKIPYANIEKTVLDMVYLAKYRHFSDEEIKNKVLELASYCSKRKIREYAGHYPKTVKKLLGEIL